jgi:hypothetical protein
VTYTAVVTEVLADAAEVGLEAGHSGVEAVAALQDVEQVEVQDVGMETADLSVLHTGTLSDQVTRGGAS